VRDFENSVLSRIFGPKRDEIIEDGKKLHNEELQNLYSLEIIMIRRRMIMGRAYDTHGKKMSPIGFR
jgi:hypothetical protein